MEALGGKTRPGGTRERRPAAAADTATREVAVFEAATRVLAGVALRSLDALGGSVSLPQFRLLAVLGERGKARSTEVARALGLDRSAITRLADRMVAAGHVIRGSDPAHRSVVTLTLSPSGQQIVTEVGTRRRRELTKILSRMPAADRAVAADALAAFTRAAGAGYGVFAVG